MKTIHNSIPSAIYILILFSLAGCNQNSFQGQQPAPAKEEEPPPEENAEDVVELETPVTEEEPPPPPPPPPPKPINFELNYDFSDDPLVSKKYAWVVTRENKVYKIEINKEENYPTKEWKLPSNLNSGHRTYVTEVGLVVGKTGGEIYLVSEDLPEPVLLIKLATTGEFNIHFDSRVCLGSYRIDDTPYLVGAFFGKNEVNVNQLRIFQVPINKTAPFSIDPNAIKYTTLNPGVWGYSCYLDQSKKIFWSAHHKTKIHGVDLTNLTYIDGVSAQNGSLSKIGQIATSSLSTTNTINYAISGDNKGNLLNGSLTGGSVYTMAYDSKSDSVMVTGGGLLLAAPGSCFADDIDCNGKYFQFAPTAENSTTLATGPISSLNDGRFISIARNQNEVWLFQYTDPADITKGVTAELIKKIDGDAYMYTDFTGGTLYFPTIEHTFSINSKVETKGKKIKELDLIWDALTPDEKWEGLTMEARCYNSEGNVPKPEYSEVKVVSNSGKPISLQSIDSCKTEDIDSVDVKISDADTGGNRSQIRKLSISGSI